MISQSYNMSEFVSVIGNKNYDDILMTTEKEATEVERHIYKIRSGNIPGSENEVEYAQSLKDLIFYLKSTVDPFPKKNPNSQLFKKISENLKKRSDLRHIILKSL